MENMEQEEVTEATEEVVKEKTFTQAEMDRVVAERLSRQKRSHEKEISGIDLDEARQLLADKEQASVDRQKERGEFEAILKDTISKKDDAYNAMRAEVEHLKVDGALLTAASNNNAIEPTQVGQLLRGKVKLTDEGVVEVLDESGLPRYNDKGTLLTVSELVGDFLTANPHFVRATQGGAGSQGNAGGSTQKPQSYAEMVENWSNGGKEAYADTLKRKK